MSGAAAFFSKRDGLGDGDCTGTIIEINEEYACCS